MRHEEGTNLYEADDGKMLVRKSDGQIMGDGVDLGVDDSIDNYEEREFTEEERAEFWESIGMPDPKRPKEANDSRPSSPRTDGLYLNQGTGAFICGPDVSASRGGA